jgi:xanthine dehydrogenase accessory factor
MDSPDRQVLDAAIAWLDAGHGVALATVARTWGSSPRQPGAWAAVREDGLVAGSVSGGCIEDDLVRRVLAGLPAPVQRREYGVTPEEATRFGLPCGGRLELVLEAQPDVLGLKDLRERLMAGQACLRCLDAKTGQVTLSDGPGATSWDGQILVKACGPRARLLLIGAGQIASFLAPMAQALDYRVTVCDPRQAYYGAWQVEGVTLTALMPDDAVTEFRPDGASAIVALTHDPKLDDLALLEALRSPAFYVGALGSQKSNARRKERLAEHFGLTEPELARLHGPVGLAIGSRTPPEIAVSVLAQMIAVQHGAHHG